eukprot:scaffold2402_cov203-Alexandrium_tamarense.AAC.4
MAAGLSSVQPSQLSLLLGLTNSSNNHLVSLAQAPVQQGRLEDLRRLYSLMTGSGGGSSGGGGGGYQGTQQDASIQQRQQLLNAMLAMNSSANNYQPPAASSATPTQLSTSTSATAARSAEYGRGTVNNSSAGQLQQQSRHTLNQQLAEFARRSNDSLMAAGSSSVQQSQLSLLLGLTNSSNNHLVSLAQAPVQQGRLEDLRRLYSLMTGSGGGSSGGGGGGYQGTQQDASIQQRDQLLNAMLAMNSSANNYQSPAASSATPTHLSTSTSATAVSSNEYGRRTVNNSWTGQLQQQSTSNSSEYKFNGSSNSDDS